MRFQKPLGLLLAVILLFSGAAATDNADTETLTINGGDVNALEVLTAYPNLRSLTLQDCPAFDLTPVASCKRLTMLTIIRSDGYSGSDVYDLSPLAQSSRLNTLILTGPCADDLSALPGITKLNNLTIDNTLATDFNPVTKLSLKHLRLFGADAEAITTVFMAIGRGLQSASVGDCTLTAEANDAVLSGTRLISLSFRNAEGIDGGSARWAKLKKLTSLTMTGGSVTSLAFCDSYVSTVAVKLTDVFIDGQVCSVDFDKYFLIASDVPQLAMLQLVQGEGRRWQYITVRQQYEPASAALIAAFADVSGLLSLDIQAVAQGAFTSETWKGFAKLEQLKLSGCTTVPLQILNELPGLLRLCVQNAALSDTEGIGSLRKLQELSLIGCTADDWSFTGMLANARLTLLNLSSCNGPANIAFIKDLEKLKVLALEHSPVTDLSPLTGLSLSDLYLYGSAIADYTPLQTLPSLANLYCNENAVLPALTCRVVHRAVIPAD